MIEFEVDFSKVKGINPDHIGRWIYGDVPNTGYSYAYIKCACGWNSGDIEKCDPEKQYKKHLARV